MKSTFKTIIILTLITSVISLIGCSKEEQPGFDQAINPIWEYDYQVGLTTGIQPIVYKDIVLFAAKSEKTEDLSANDQLIALDKESGDLKWKWNDHFEGSGQSFDGKSVKPIASDIIAITSGSRNFGIDLNNGVTKWKNKNAHSSSSSDLSLVDHT
ncbi:MAG: hypothetical protein AAFO69_20170, partial [Bacteroidota bacterium]